MTSKQALESLKNHLQYCSYDKELSALEKDIELLDILKKCPFILEKIFVNCEYEDSEQGKDYSKRYMFGTITNDEVEKVKEWLGL